MNKIYTALGTMSGTSLDGIDFSIIETDGEDYLNIIDSEYLGFSNNLKDRISNLKLKIKSTDECRAIIKSKEYKELSREITLLHYEGIQTIITHVHKIPIHVVGFHGITLWHKPEDKFTHQLGDPLLLKKEFNKHSHLKKSSLIFDFRKNDILNGGQGAPLTPLYHRAIMKHLKILDPRLIVNIGGIINVTYLNRGNIFSTDIGPGNCLIDKWIKKNFNKNFDKDGKISLEGRVNKIIANNFLNRLSIFKKKNISYDTSDFDLSEFKKLSPKNGAATLSYISAKTILNYAKNLDVKIIILCGGGRYNQAILNILKNDKFIIISIDELDFGIGGQGDFIESQAFAYLAIRSYLNLPISFPETTGVREPCNGGTIVKNF
jgi:anhydro-N-acetylmuramic acid kinase|tara:strand:- start:105 stop:1235 length:1131 start_codon:yes stop_codon:yes gene_type:complete